jgi:hypothetical protein
MVRRSQNAQRATAEKHKEFEDLLRRACQMRNAKNRRVRRPTLAAKSNSKSH